MKNSHQQFDASLSFVDVVTNGLGAMLVLFFVIVLLQTQLEWTAAHQHGAETTRPLEDPFVIIARVDEGTFSTDDNVWLLENFGRGEQKSVRGQTYDWGPRHAVLLLEEPPPIGAQISLRGGAEGLRVSVEIHHGRQKSLRRVEDVAPGQNLSVWPPEVAVIGKEG